jgi:hypothetical protein
MEQGAHADAPKFIRPEFEKLIERKKHRHFLSCSRGRRPRQRPGDWGKSRLLVPINKIVLSQNTRAKRSPPANAATGDNPVVEASTKAVPVIAVRAFHHGDILPSAKLAGMADSESLLGGRWLQWPTAASSSNHYWNASTARTRSSLWQFVALVRDPAAAIADR